VASEAIRATSSVIEDELYGAGITAHRGAFSRAWAQAMREDIDHAFADAIARP
jgi:hypothetical protein